jgi:hypothetical protein
VPGAVVILGLGIGSLRLQAPCRVVYMVDEPRRRGFAYGTLAGHPESGEEAFMIEHHDDDTVSFKVTAFSRPATRLAKLAGPVGAVVQRQVTARYLRSLGKIARPLAAINPVVANGGRLTSRAKSRAKPNVYAGQRLYLLTELLTRLVGTGGDGTRRGRRSRGTSAGQRDAPRRRRDRRRTSYGS